MFTARLIYVNERWACAYLFFYIIMYTYILLFIRLANIVVLSLFGGKILIFFRFAVIVRLFSKKVQGLFRK